MKRIVLLTALLISLSASAYDFESDGLFFNILSESEKTCEVTKPPRNCRDRKIVYIPEVVTYNGNSYSVKSITSNSFDYWSVKILDIPKSVVSIEDDAFMLSIEKIFIEGTVPPKITNYSFPYQCYRDSKVYVPTGCASAYKQADGWKSFTNIEEGITEIYADDYDMFFNITSQENKTCELASYTGQAECFTIPQSVRGFTVTSIGETAFKMHGNDVFGIWDNNIYLKTVVLPNTITTIKPGIFQYCTSLKTVVLPQSILNIDTSAFSGCTNLENIYIQALEPPMVQTDAFSELQDYDVTLNVPKGTIASYRDIVPWNNFEKITERDYGSPEDNIFKYNNLTYSVLSEKDLTCELRQPESDYYSGDIEVPEYAEYKNKKYTVLSIGRNAFRGCKDLTSVKMPNALKIISKYAFASCSLTYITIPDNVEKIYRYAFLDDNRLKTITMGCNVSMIGDSAFTMRNTTGYADYCMLNVEKFYCKNPIPPKSIGYINVHTNPDFCTIHFYGQHTIPTLYVPKGSKELYENEKHWRFDKIEEIDFSSIEDVADDSDDITVTTCNGKILVLGKEDKDVPIEIYNLSGQTVYRGYDCSVEVSQRGIYIVHADGKAIKVVI